MDLNIGEYAKRVCKEIGWPYSGNLTLLCDCISSLAFKNGVDAWGGFTSLMEAVELAQQQHMRIDRWFFQDGRYMELVQEVPPSSRKKQPGSEPAPEAAELRRKPN